MADYDITAAFEAIENELIDSMMKNFARHRAEETKEGYLWSQWQAEQLKSLEQYRRQNEKKFTAKFSQLNGKVADMLRRARADGSAAQEADILQAIQSGFKGYAKTPPNAPSATFFKLNDRKLDALIKATADDLKSAETAILRMSNDRYRKAIFNAQVYANTGAATYEKAVDMACRDMLRAGLNCVEYKNGARHTLSDYAHMAIRTANKRAYLYGEGQKRQQWGISTVVVNGRRGGCPLCTPYIGRVFIDDVYSGGKRDASSGKAYPLLSEAIKSGLFHPNCKDSTSTYYEGITTLQPVTEEEQAEMERREQLEAKESYYKNEAKKNRRIAKYSLDADNKRTYSHRAEAFEQKAQNAEKALANSENSGIMKAGSGDMALEYQRYGRNKDTLVNKTYIDSGEYRRKFDNATENASVNKTLYDSAKAALKHRSGTLYEDMYWIDGNSGKVVFSVTDSTLEEGIPNTDSIKRHVKPSGNIITLHSHPGSMPPSASDLNSNFFNNYKMGFVACHNGVVFGYTSNEEISETLYTMYINKFLNDGFDDFTAQMKALQVLSQNYKIKIWEVSLNG